MDNVSVGVPVFVTVSLHVTVISILSPTLYVASAAATDESVGEVASTITVPRSPLAAAAVFPATSLIVPS